MPLGNRAQVILTVLATITLISVVNTVYGRWNTNVGERRRAPRSTDWKPVAAAVASDNLVLAPGLWRDLVRMGGVRTRDTAPSTIVALLDHRCAVCDSALAALRALELQRDRKIRVVVLFLLGPDTVPPGTIAADCAREQGIEKDASVSTGSLRLTGVEWKHIASRLRIPDVDRFMACVGEGKAEAGRANPGRAGLRRLLGVRQTPAIWVNRVLWETSPARQLTDSLVLRTSLLERP